MAETSEASDKPTTNGTNTHTHTHTHHHTHDHDHATNAEDGEAPQQTDNILRLRVLLPTKENVDIMVSSSEQIQEIRQSIVDQPHTFQYSCFHLEYKGKRVNDFVEVGEVEGLVEEAKSLRSKEEEGKEGGEVKKGEGEEKAVELTLVEDPYTEAAARMHVVRVRELIGASGNRVDWVSGIDAGISLCEEVELPASQRGGKEDSTPVPSYDLSAPGNINSLIPKQREPAPKTVKSISLSAWNPPPYNLRNRGHVLYLVVTTLEGDQHYITSHTTGFYVNRSTNAKFDPEPRQLPGKNSRAHSLITLLSQISDRFAVEFVKLQEYNGQRDPLASYALSNSIPAAPWLVSPSSAALSAHQPDASRPQEPFLLSGADNAETLRDWNEEFQSTRELPSATVQDRVFRERLTSKLFAEYNDAAVHGAVLVARGEVQPLDPTEGKDAQIFVYGNVFYSFGFDGVGTFASDGGDEAARVAVGKDVAGVRAVNQLDVNGIFTAGTVVVDYMGKRVVGQSIVPGIFKQRDPGEHQIDYGGVEGKDVIASHEGFKEGFAKLSEAMRVKPHAVWDKESKRHDLEASVETKGLLGTDGRKYILDLYRLTPLDVAWLEQYRSEEVGEEERYPHRMTVLRPELVDSYRISKLREFIAAELSKKKEGKEEKEERKALTNGSSSTTEEAEAQANGDSTALTNGDSQTGEENKEEPKSQETVDVSGFKFSLNPDVFSGQQPQTEEEKAEMEEDEKNVRLVCSYLTDEVIPRLVRDMQDGEVGFPMDGQGLVRDMHKRGVNARYLGEMARQAKAGPVAVNGASEGAENGAGKEDKRGQLLVQLTQQEMVARAFKHVAIKALRNLPPAFSQNAISHLLNCLLGAELNGKPAVEMDEQMKLLFPDGEFGFAELTPQSLAKELQRQIKLRFRYEIPADEVVGKGKEMQMLREVCLKLGWQVEAREYQFSKEQTMLAEPKQALQNKASAESLEVPQSNGVHHAEAGSGSSKNKKKKKAHTAERSPNRAESATPTGPPTTFRPENVLNIVPIVKEASPRSMLSEEALDAGRMSLQQDQKELGQELLLESLSLHEQIYGILHPEVARVYYALSTLYFGLEEKNAAVELAKKAVIVSERTLGVDHAETIMAYLNLSLMEHATGSTRNALALVRHALGLWKIVYGTRHPDSITTINNAAVMLQTLKQFKESRAWFAVAVDICTEVSGKNTVSSATLLFQYAQALALDHDPRLAVEKMRESYLIFRDLLGAENGNTKEAGAWLDTLARSAVNQEKAAKDASSMLGSDRRRMFLRNGGMRSARLGAGAGQRSSQAGSSSTSAEVQQAVADVQARARGMSLTDKRNLEELVKYVTGGEEGTRTTPKKKTANPKRRQQRAQ